MDSKTVMEKSLQSEPIKDLEIIGEIKDCHKGARKTMPSARNCHRDVKMLSSMIISRSNPSSEINVPSVSMSDTLNTGLSPITSMSNATSTIMSKLETGELEIKSSHAVNSDKLSKSQGLFKLTAEKTSNRPVSFQTKTNLLGNGRKIYNKRPLESREFSNIDLDKVHKSPCMLDCPEYRSRNDENEQGLLEGRKIIGIAESSKENIKSKILKKSMTDADLTNVGLVRLKDISVKHPDTPRPFHKSKFIERKFPKTSEVPIEKDSQIINQQVNIDGSNSGIHLRKETGLNQELQGSNMKTMNRDFVPIMTVQNAARMRKVEDFVAVASSTNSVPEPPYMPVSNVRSMQDVRPMFCMMPPYACRNVLMPSNQAFDGRSQYRMVGTASRAMNAMENQRLPLMQGQMSGIDVFNSNYPYTAGFPLQQAITAPRNLNPEKLQNPAKLRISKKLRKSKAIKTITRTTNRIQLQSHETKKVDSIMIRQNEVTHEISKSEIATEDLRQSERKKSTRTVAGNCGNETKANKKQASVKTRDNKIQEAQSKVMKVSELLRDINKTFHEGFECAGMEESLPIWRSELVQCILSVENIGKVLSEYQEKKQ